MRRASRRNGRNCCAISIGCNRCASSIAAPIGWCAPTRRRQSPPCSARPMSRCRRERDKPPRRSLRPPRNPSKNAEAAPSVVPRRLEFRCKWMKIRCLSKSGVQVGPNGDRPLRWRPRAAGWSAATSCYGAALPFAFSASAGCAMKSSAQGGDRVRPPSEWI